MQVDKNDYLKGEPFDYRLLKDQKVQIFWEGKPVMILSGRKAIDLIEKLNDGDSFDQQLLLAKATGNFKRGNERTSKNSKKY